MHGNGVIWLAPCAALSLLTCKTDCSGTAEYSANGNATITRDQRTTELVLSSSTARVNSDFRHVEVELAFADGPACLELDSLPGNGSTRQLSELHATACAGRCADTATVHCEALGGFAQGDGAGRSCSGSDCTSSERATLTVHGLLEGTIRITTVNHFPNGNDPECGKRID
jgi:hypothetical protein